MITRGQDYDVQITLELEDETVLQPSTLEDLYIYLVNIRRYVTLDKYSLNAETGFGDITVDDDVNGIVTVILGHDITELAPIGKFMAEVKAIKSNVDYPDGLQKYTCTLYDDDWDITEGKSKSK